MIGPGVPGWTTVFGQIRTEAASTELGGVGGRAAINMSLLPELDQPAAPPHTRLAAPEDGRTPLTRTGRDRQGPFNRCLSKARAGGRFHRPRRARVRRRTS